MTTRKPGNVADLGEIIRALPSPVTVDRVTSEFTGQDMFEVRPLNRDVVEHQTPVDEASEHRGLTPRAIRLAVAKVRAAKQTDADGRRRPPTRLEVADELGTSESTLKRAMKDARMGKWPPAPPKD